jgi:hypothetical protein
MQHVTLRPGLLTFRGGDWSNAGQIVYDEQHRTIQNGRLFARLSPLEYILVMALLRQRERSQMAPSRCALCVTVRRLCKISGSESEQSIHHALNGAKQKVEGLGVRVIRLHDRYLVLWASEVEGEGEGEDDEEEEDSLVELSPSAAPKLERFTPKLERFTPILE